MLRQIHRLDRPQVVIQIDAQRQQVAGAGLQGQQGHDLVAIGLGLHFEVSPCRAGEAEQQLAALAKVDLEALGLDPRRLVLGIKGKDLGLTCPF